MSEIIDKTDPGDYFKDTSVAENYDRYIGENIPYYHSTVSTICDYVKNAYGQTASEKHAIEFGAGTANVSLALPDRVGLARCCCSTTVLGCWKRLCAKYKNEVWLRAASKHFDRPC
jgi:hypothetical protein